jgi:uncharacterized protein (DUF433 family)
MNNARNARDVRELAGYGMAELTTYLRLKRKTVEYWVESGDPPLLNLPEKNPPRFSFMNLLECHVLNAMRLKGIHLSRIRLAVKTIQQMNPSTHPLLDNLFHTDGHTLFFDTAEQLLDIGRGGQGTFRQFLIYFLERIERQGERILFYPFLEPQMPVARKTTEPKIIQIDPLVSFGRPVIAGTGISTAMVASRFAARESIADLAKEYGRPASEIEEAVRWEGHLAA